MLSGKQFFFIWDAKPAVIEFGANATGSKSPLMVTTNRVIIILYLGMLR